MKMFSEDSRLADYRTVPNTKKEDWTNCRVLTILSGYTITCESVQAIKVHC